MQELKKAHEDWDNAKVEKTATMLVGREIKQEEAKAIKDAHEKKVADAIKAENPGIDEKELAKLVKKAIAKEELDEKKSKADKDIAEKYTALFDAIVARSKLDETKQSSSEIPKDVKEAIKKVKNLNID